MKKSYGNMTNADILILAKDLGVGDLREINSKPEQEYYIFQGSFYDSHVLFKVGGKECFEKIDKEIAVDKIMQTLSRTEFATNKILKYGSTQGYKWLIKDFYPGKPLAKLPDTDELFIHPIDPIFYGKEEELAKLIVENSLALYENSKGSEFKLGIPRISSDIDQYVNEVSDILPFSLKKQVGFFQDKFSGYFSKEELGLSVGDLAPTNIIVNPNQSELIFTDLEWLCIDNKTLDLAYLWLFLWKYPRWQKEIFRFFKEKFGDDAIDSFQLSMLRIILYWYDRLLLLADDRGECINRIKKHCWTDYIREIGNDFVS